MHFSTQESASVVTIFLQGLKDQILYHIYQKYLGKSKPIKKVTRLYSK